VDQGLPPALGAQALPEKVMQDAFIWARQAHFSAEMLASLRDLNLRFLDLIAAHAMDPFGEDASRIAPEATGRIVPLTGSQRAAAADCPYALFDLKLGDGTHWESRLAGQVDPRVADAPPVAEDLAGFMRLTLFYAWHVASTPRSSAQLWLGMSEGTATLFRSMPLDRLPALAASSTSHLSARWCACGFFWNALASSASRGDERRLRKVHLFGLQLAAAALLP
jgi:hypothetical protein